MFKKALITYTVLIIALSCETNPPTIPYIQPTGNITLTLKIDRSNNYLTAHKIVLLENFGNISCNPCPAVNRLVKKLANEKYGRSKVVPIKFPTNFPSPVDLFYLAASEACDYRMNFYNIMYAPAIIIDGKLRPIASDSISISEAIESRLFQTPKFYINMTTKIEGDYFIDINIGLIDTSELDMKDFIINTAITETNIKFQTPPGSGGETEFYDVIRLMLPALNGITLEDLINQRELQYEFPDIILSNWTIENLNAIVFIQNKNSFEVYQTASTFR